MRRFLKIFWEEVLDVWKKENTKSWKFHPFWTPHGQKFWFGLFDHRATRIWDCILRCDKMGQISTFLPWRENFAPVHDASGLECIPPGNFTHFCRPVVKNYELVFLTIVRPKSMFGRFDHRATIILSRYFWPMVRLMGD